DDKAISTLYISGQPGTGKTALVTDVLKKLAEQDSTSSLTPIYVNCTGLSDVKAVWDRVWEEVVQSSGGSAGSKLKPGEAKKHFESALKRDQGFRCVLVLDEVDYVSKTTSSLSEIYQFARNHSGTLRLIGIANTLTLGAEAKRASPATPTKPPRTSLTVVGPQKSMNFTAYTHTDLSTIINARLSPLSAEERTSMFNPAALNFLSKKVAAVNGDVRYCLSVLRRCVESAEKESVDGTGKGKVEMKHVLESLRAHESAKTGATTGASSGAGSGGSSISRTVRNMGLHPRLALVALLIGWRRLQADLPLTVGHTSSKSTTTSDVEKLTAPTLYNFYVTLLTATVVSDLGEAGPSTPFNPVSRGEFQDILGLLETSGLVSFPNEVPPALARSISASASTPSFPTAPISPPKTPSRNRIIRPTSFGTPSRSVSASGGGRKRVCEPCVVLNETIREEEVVRGLTTPGSPDKGMTTQEKEVERVWTRELKKVGKDEEKRERKQVEERERDAVRARAFEDAQD
ncbi:hypothetical protein M407DRAFT_20576, partial [Tulasnella calospora MUT 4182]